jgi:hypothetical protein
MAVQHGAGRLPADLSQLSDQDLTRLEDQVREIQQASGGLRELFESIIDEIEEERGGRSPGGVRNESGVVDMPDRLTGEPQDIVVHQREAMVRAVALRDDPDQPEVVRELWAEVVKRLADARHAAKEELARTRREDPSLPGWMELEALSRDEARSHDRERQKDGTAAGGGPDVLESEGELGRAGVKFERDDIQSGADEPAPWQPEHATVGPESGPRTTPMNVAVTDQLTSGPGMAGGTGGAGSQNLPVDTGAEMPDLHPSKDGDEPPDTARR